MATLPAPPPSAETTARPLRRFTAEEYHRMGETGILGDDERVELLEGRIVTMSPIGSRHLGTVSRLNRLFSRTLGVPAVVSVRNPVRLGEGDGYIEVCRGPSPEEGYGFRRRYRRGETVASAALLDAQAPVEEARGALRRGTAGD